MKKTAIALAISSLFVSTAVFADNEGAQVSDDINALGVTMQALHDGDADVSDVMNKIQLPEPAVSHFEEAMNKSDDDHGADDDSQDDHGSDSPDDHSPDDVDHEDMSDNDHGKDVSDAAHDLKELKDDSDSGHDFAKDVVHETVVEMAHDSVHRDDISEVVDDVVDSSHDMSQDVSDSVSDLDDM